MVEGIYSSNSRMVEIWIEGGERDLTPYFRAFFAVGKWFPLFGSFLPSSFAVVSFFSRELEKLAYILYILLLKRPRIESARV